MRSKSTNINFDDNNWHLTVIGALSREKGLWSSDIEVDVVPPYDAEDDPTIYVDVDSIQICHNPIWHHHTYNALNLKYWFPISLTIAVL